MLHGAATPVDELVVAVLDRVELPGVAHPLQVAVDRREPDAWPWSRSMAWISWALRNESASASTWVDRGPWRVVLFWGRAVGHRAHRHGTVSPMGHEPCTAWRRRLRTRRGCAGEPGEDVGPEADPRDEDGRLDRRGLEAQDEAAVGGDEREARPRGTSDPASGSR